jgi:tetratricopeptide (TPR) repeat protein
MKRKVFIAITATMISAFASVSSAQVKTPLPSSQPSKSVPALSEEQIKSLIQAETEKKDALRGQAEAERKFNFTMTWVQVLLAGVSALAIIPVLLGLFFLIFRKSIFGQLNAEATKEVRKQVEDHLRQTIETEVEDQVFALIERIKKLNQLVQEFEAAVPASTQEKPSPEKLSQIEDLRRQIEDLQDLMPTMIMQSAEYYLKQGNAFYFEGQYEEALIFYNKALELKPDELVILSNRGCALGNLSRYEEEIACYDRALESKPNDPVILSNRGVALDNLSRYEEAVLSYKKALKFNPNGYTVWLNLGITLSHLNRHEEALFSYDKAIEFNPENPDAWSDKGAALGNLERYEEAITAFDKALKFNPDHPRILSDRGGALAGLNRYEEAIASYDQAIHFKPDYSNAWYNRACCYALQGKIEETVRDLKKAIELDLIWREKAKTDSNFDKVRQDKRFQQLLKNEP